MDTVIEDLSIIDKQGFIHIPSFLKDSEIKQLSEDFYSNSPLNNANYHVRSVSPEVLSLIQGKLTSLAEQVSQQTNTTVNELPRTGLYFPTWKEGRTLVNHDATQQKFPWHMDHESFFMLQDHTNYLNFYIPLIKPVPEKSNLSVIPLDRLAERLPNISKYLIGRGAIRVIKDKEGRDLILDDDQGGVLARLDFSITDIEETPYLKAGDLLLLRGDVLHRTQDTSTQRVAVSFRMANQDVVISREKLVSGGLVKTVMMLSNWRSYELRFRYFDETKSKVATQSVVKEYISSHELTTDFKGYHFLLRLLKEKLIAGKLLQTILDIRRLPLIMRNRS